MYTTCRYILAYTHQSFCDRSIWFFFFYYYYSYILLHFRRRRITRVCYDGPLSHARISWIGQISDSPRLTISRFIFFFPLRFHPFLLTIPEATAQFRRLSDVMAEYYMRRTQKGAKSIKCKFESPVRENVYIFLSRTWFLVSIQ